MPSTDMTILEDDLTHPQVRELIRQHLEGMHANSPACSVFALDIDGLRQPDVTFWTAWDTAAADGPTVMGCGALKELDAGSAAAGEHGELKSMRTTDAYLGRGVAARMLAHILDVARSRGYVRVSLETGTGDYFEPAVRLYLRAGFTRTGPFATYTDDTFSRYYAINL